VIDFGAKLLQVDRDVIAAAWRRLRPHLRRNGGIEPSAVRGTVATLLRFGFIDKSFDGVEALDLRFLPTAAE